MLVILRRSWWNYALRGVLAVLFGLGIWIAALLVPAVTLRVLVIAFGAYIIVEGAFALVAAVRQRDREGWGLLFFEGLVGLLFGLVAFLWTGISALVLVAIIAAWAIITGIMEIATFIRLGKTIAGRWMLIFSGIFSILFGVLVLLFPAAGAVVLMWLLGAYALVFGILITILGFMARRLQVDEGREPPHTVRTETGTA